jgi:superfamily II DNA or RNA helicase
VDALTVRPEDSDFTVSTDKADVERFLAQTSDDAVKVVFSTYQSAQVVAEGMEGSDPFDIGIFDEAHKTAGREGSKFAFALFDENLAIRKRLFFTATPRHYNINRKNKEGDTKLVFSMDNKAVYGPVVHKLSFAEAAKRDIICNYKVIVSVVDGQMVNNDLINRGETLVKDDLVRSRQVAVQLALQQAVEEFGVGRIITFHSTVKAAAGFVAEGAEGVQNHLTDFSTFHVNGKQRSADRDDYLRGFAKADKGLITNARCLTEGVDVPAVDMVAFVAPRRSKVDIVQATGRAMRKAGPDKHYGYVMLPLFLEREEGETLEDALERSQFKEIADVLNAMQEQDDELADIIRQLQVDKGRVGSVNDSRLADRLVTLGPQVGLTELRRAISARLIEKLGVSWNEHFGQLIAYKEQYGDCKIPLFWPENPKLGKWVNGQRVSYKDERLNEHRFRRLDELGFIWDLSEANWEEMFTALVSYKDHHKDCDVPGNWQESPKLGNWVVNHRQSYKAGNLKEDHFRRLDELGFIWDLSEANWEEMFTALVSYKDHHKDCDVPGNWQESSELGKWVIKQRGNYKAGNLKEDHFRRLDELGFVWKKREAAWEEMFTALVVYKKQHGDCNVPRNWQEMPTFGRWVETQRQRYKYKVLADDQFRRLDELDFVWSQHDANWEEMFTALASFKDQHKNCDIPRNWSENPKLENWVATQRNSRQTGSLKEDRIKRLDEIGFEWECGNRVTRSK